MEALAGRIGECVERAAGDRTGRDERGEQELKLLRLDRRGASAWLGLGWMAGVIARAVQMELGAGAGCVPIQERKRLARGIVGAQSVVRGRRSMARRGRGRILRGERVRDGEHHDAADEHQGREPASADQSSSLAS